MVIEDIVFLLVRKLDRTIAPWTGRTEVDSLNQKSYLGMYVWGSHRLRLTGNLDQDLWLMSNAKIECPSTVSNAVSFTLSVLSLESF